ncbi:MAG: DUF4935 domain-containing protein, partial [Deltaproteobacteria bacterium]|nr:DUF4935 domain-containing protein [Deltaproteobacteria bacterium]
MARHERYILDTNFFISAFKEKPQESNTFLNFCKMAGITITTTQKVINEINWYLRRRIEKEIELVQISKPRFSEFKKTADILLKTNQEADLSVLYAAVSNGGKIVSSDMALLESAEELNLASLSCSAFLLHIIENT